MRLRPLASPGDIARVAGWLALKENWQWLDFGHGLQQVSAPVLAVMARRDTHLLRVYTDDHDDTPVGLVGLHGIDRNFRTATFWGLSGDKSFAHRGYSTYAGSRLMSLAFNELRLAAVSAWAVEGNPSVRTIERLGFRRIGRQRRCHVIDGRVCDRLLFDLLAEEHRELPVPAPRRSGAGVSA
jgi:RimJ/RimL family protein N-acetyltransferase